jgi:hypothetical protein
MWYNGPASLSAGVAAGKVPGLHLLPLPADDRLVVFATSEDQTTDNRGLDCTSHQPEEKSAHGFHHGFIERTSTC